MDAIVYIDGFNLYNGAVKRTMLKWLDLSRLLFRLLPGRRIKRIRYFTARIQGFDHDPTAPARQDLYLRALKTLAPLLVIHEGWFASHPVLLPQFPLAYTDSRKPPQRPPQAVQILKFEEKWTDVNIAAYMVLDCVDEIFDEVVLVSNDSDLVPPLEIAKNRFGKTITIINPHRPANMSGHLFRLADNRLRTINKKALAACQFPSTLSDAQGTFTKPQSW